MRRLVEVDWRVPLGVEDAIQSYLVEHPDSYYISGNNQHLWYLDRDLGLVLLQHDFSRMNDEEISEYLIGVLDLMTDGQQEGR